MNGAKKKGIKKKFVFSKLNFDFIKYIQELTMKHK